MKRLLQDVAAALLIPLFFGYCVFMIMHARHVARAGFGGAYVLWASR